MAIHGTMIHGTALTVTVTEAGGAGDITSGVMAVPGAAIMAIPVRITAPMIHIGDMDTDLMEILSK